MHAPTTTKSIRSPLNGCATSSPRDISRQATLTNDQSLTCAPQTSEATRNAISSQASADGATRCASRGGRTTRPFGRVLAPVSLSQKQESVSVSEMFVTFGPHCSTSHASAHLQSSLENRLRTAKESNGPKGLRLTL